MDTTSMALLCLSLNIYNEARGEPLKGQQAVAEVTLRRVKDTRWANTVCGVVYQPFQFSWTLQQFSATDALALDIATAVAAKAYYGNYNEVTTCADHYYNPDIVNPKWAQGMYVETTIGHHKFLCSEVK